MKAQVSVEHLLIIGIAVFILIPATMLFYNYAKNSNEEVIKSQISRIGDNVIHNAEIMSILGRESRVVLDVNLPESVNDLYIEGGELIFNFTTLGGDSEMLFFSDVNITGMPNEGDTKENISKTFHTGYMKIKIENMGDYIFIREVY